MTKKTIGLAAGVLLAVLIWNLPLDGLSRQGQACLALTLMTVVFWACQVAQSGYISGLYLAMLVVLGWHNRR